MCYLSGTVAFKRCPGLILQSSKSLVARGARDQFLSSSSDSEEYLCSLKSLFPRAEDSRSLLDGAWSFGLSPRGAPCRLTVTESLKLP